jgi:hypothetical protein
MKKIICKYSFIVVACFAFSLLSHSSQAQKASSLFQGFSIEIGGGYNQLFWEATEFDGSKIEADRKAFSLMPSVRISYETNILRKINLSSFVGYNEFGGHSELHHPYSSLDPDVRYKDQIKFKNVEAGFFGKYPISNINIGIGMKVNYHIDFEQRSYYENNPQGQNGWNTSDDSFFFKNWSLDAGFRLEYPIFQNFSFGTEGWFGLTDLGKDKYPIFVRQNHFRLLIGYRF